MNEVKKICSHTLPFLSQPDVQVHCSKVLTMAKKGISLILLLISSFVLVHSSSIKEYENEESHYFFGRESFKPWGKSENGRFAVMDRFSKKSQLFRGLDNYLLALMIVQPNTFAVPNHLDADEVLYVMEGRGAITVITADNERESYDIERGDIMGISAGSVVYLINKDDKEILHIAMILCPVFTPGHFQEFYGVGGEDPETFYKSFSDQILEAALKISKEKFDKLFNQLKEGPFIKASDEQIIALSNHSTEGWPPLPHSHKPFNLLKKSPTHSNDHGDLREATSKDYKHLRELNIDVSIVNISSGSMMAPNYNTRATMIALMIQGEGLLEMVCPRMSKGDDQEEKRPSYVTVRSKLSAESVFLIPPGCPVVLAASKDQGIVVLWFGLGGGEKKNKRVFLAGRGNAVSKMEKEAKELAFGRSAAEVDEVFGAQDGEMFFVGPKEESEDVLSFASF